jgi:hypothetical protein
MSMRVAGREACVKEMDSTVIITGIIIRAVGRGIRKRDGELYAWIPVTSITVSGRMERNMDGGDTLSRTKTSMRVSLLMGTGLAGVSTPGLTAVSTMASGSETK